MERRFERDISSLNAIFAFVNEFVVRHALDDRTVFAITMAIEELFTNMVKYNQSGGGDILVSLERRPDDVAVGMVDFDSEPFDITELEEVDTTAPLQARRPGGLGIHLVRSFMDEVTYEYKNRQTRIHLVKRVP